MRYVIAYDVTEDAKRTRLSNRLLDYGVRTQKSVFEADLTREEAQEVLAMASNYIETGDSLRMYPMCKTCAQGCLKLGRADTVYSSLRIV